MSGVNAETSRRVTQIVQHEARAAKLQGQADHHRWIAARLITEELDAGKTHRQLAKEIGKSHVHVGAMARVWRHHGGNPDYQQAVGFNELYRVATGQASQDDDPPDFNSDPSDQPRLDQRKATTCPSCGCTWRIGPRGAIEVVSS